MDHARYLAEVDVWAVVTDNRWNTQLSRRVEKLMAKRGLIVGLVIVGLLSARCSSAHKPSDLPWGGAPIDPAITGQGQVRSSPPITSEEALDAVRKQPAIVELTQAVQVAGYKVVFDIEETPSRFIVRVGEDRGSRITYTRWYLVSKGDGTAVQWNVAKGPPPRD
jgi:hypothetical protein